MHVTMTESRRKKGALQSNNNDLVSSDKTHCIENLIRIIDSRLQTDNIESRRGRVIAAERHDLADVDSDVATIRRSKVQTAIRHSLSVSDIRHVQQNAVE